MYTWRYWSKGQYYMGHCKTGKKATDTQRNKQQDTEAIGVGAKGSLLTNYLAIHNWLKVNKLIKRMSQQAATGQVAKLGGGRKSQYHPRGWGVNLARKSYKSTISEITLHTFNMTQNNYAVQFTQSRNEVANYLQQTLVDEGYLVAETIQTGKKKSIPLPPPVDVNAPDKADLDIIQAEDVKTVAKR